MTAGSLFISRNAGKIWTTAAAPLSESPLSGLLAAPWDSGAVLAAAGSSVFVSRDSAKTWSKRQFPGAIRSLVALDSSWIAAIAESDIYVSRDGKVWEGYGHVAGRVFSYKGTLIVDTSARVEADINVAVCVVSGTVEGDIIGHERVEVTPGAVVRGNIATRSLSIKPGAIFQGDCRMLRDHESDL